jgi:hypothetical protein
MHVLDAVMIPLEQMNATTSGTPTGAPSPTSSSDGPASSTGAAATFAIGSGGWNWTLWALLGTAIMFAEGLGGRWLLVR